MFLAALMFFSLPADAANVELLWDANTEEDLAGYRIYQLVPGTPASWVQIGADIPCAPNDATCCEYTVVNLTDGTYSWAGTAFDDAGNESEHSDVASITIDGTAPGKPSNFKSSVIIN